MQPDPANDNTPPTLTDLAELPEDVAEKYDRMRP